MKKNLKQIALEQKKIDEFDHKHFREDQLNDLITLTNQMKIKDSQYVVDIGGGVGYFAQILNEIKGYSVRVIDSNRPSIDRVNQLNNKSIEGRVGDALNPEISGDESIICFNMILHHLVGGSENHTKMLQKQALLAWKESPVPIFVNEYIYESFIKNLSGYLIYKITSNKTLSFIGAIISKIIPSLRANTFGVGVRFRSHKEWVNLFEECGLKVSSIVYGKPEYISPPLRLLCIHEIRRDSFLLVK